MCTAICGSGESGVWQRRPRVVSERHRCRVRRHARRRSPVAGDAAAAAHQLSSRAGFAHRQSAACGPGCRRRHACEFMRIQRRRRDRTAAADFGNHRPTQAGSLEPPQRARVGAGQRRLLRPRSDGSLRERAVAVAHRWPGARIAHHAGERGQRRLPARLRRRRLLPAGGRVRTHLVYRNPDDPPGVAAVPRRLPAPCTGPSLPLSAQCQRADARGADRTPGRRLRRAADRRLRHDRGGTHHLQSAAAESAQTRFGRPAGRARSPRGRCGRRRSSARTTRRR